MPEGFLRSDTENLPTARRAATIDAAESEHHEDPAAEQGRLDSAAQPAAERHAELDRDHRRGGNQ